MAACGAEHACTCKARKGPEAGMETHLLPHLKNYRCSILLGAVAPERLAAAPNPALPSMVPVGAMGLEQDDAALLPDEVRGVAGVPLCIRALCAPKHSASARRDVCSVPSWLRWRCSRPVHVLMIALPARSLSCPHLPPFRTPIYLPCCAAGRQQRQRRAAGRGGADPHGDAQ